MTSWRRVRQPTTVASENMADATSVVPVVAAPVMALTAIPRDLAT